MSAQRIRDDLNRDLVLLREPQRIVSLVPSDTDSLFALGLGGAVVGRTRYCIEPAGRVDTIAVCGGTKDIDVDAVAALAPDLILANKEENSRPALEKLAERGLPVFVSFPRRVADGLAHVARIARWCGVAADVGVKDLMRRGYDVVREAESAAPAERVATFVPIWMNPLMTFNADTFASDMLTLAGARNVFAGRPRYYPFAADTGRRDPLPDAALGERDTRYPRVTHQEVVASAPKLVLLPDEPYAFTPADADEFRRQGIGARIEFADGKDLFWYGTRSITGLPRLRALVGG